MAATVWGEVFQTFKSCRHCGRDQRLWHRHHHPPDWRLYFWPPCRPARTQRRTCRRAGTDSLSTLLIGLTPGCDRIGITAPALLILFRLVQGISFGAEFGTASTWVIEQAARSQYRAFWSAWVGFAIPIGLLLGFGSVILVKSSVSQQAFMARRRVRVGLELDLRARG